MQKQRCRAVPRARPRDGVVRMQVPFGLIAEEALMSSAGYAQKLEPYNDTDVKIDFDSDLLATRRPGGQHIPLADVSMPSRLA
ncbi:hypothetical protein Nepgr_026842 [Nepenthes gracilis]|uniref:Uncharacterized protein n=1 Tax=Nepenthes gracilis TaxID=150966 RepID=A0AAD3T940_NEPGR|nr:hypothetical protein Nepgr_026842 [Nepenthes gracilis]